ncbi:hypothetical protein H5410_003307, partial [Solanum commersonii]
LGTPEHLVRIRPFGDSPNGLGDPQTFFSLFFQLPCSLLLHSVHALSLRHKIYQNQALKSPNRGLINSPNLNICFSSSKTQVQQFKKVVSNSATQDTTVNTHQKSQLTQARINFAFKVSTCESPLSKNLELTILSSNASSSSTKEIKCPHKKNDSIFTDNGSTILSSGFKCNSHTHKDEH